MVPEDAAWNFPLIGTNLGQIDPWTVALRDFLHAHTLALVIRLSGYTNIWMCACVCVCVYVCVFSGAHVTSVLGIVNHS